MGNLDNQYIIRRLQEDLQFDVHVIGESFGLLSLGTSKERIIDLLKFLKEDDTLGFSYLTDITAVHYPGLALPFCIVYHLHNLVENVRIRVKVFIGGEVPSIPTATVLWHGANWMERETYDFFGIDFQGHPDLRRILNMDDLEVFPMRKEYPLEDPNRVDKKDFYFGR
ncbi:NADH-quinone oxidoreductase subunit C [Sphingobacterium shayense]|uniref:NADH-quinone oxidoreductase subunit C n=1 Tax=Sphingobacterium shayense TaxID=626343 RepID=UPI0015533894|nr:NADH-quinone oxidoreductase subunit C [Sphingobacterium shayense]NQD70262.1 NADH-quinone oxidoreductase subunit C [Sphingobacterium shayense]